MPHPDWTLNTNCTVNTAREGRSCFIVGRTQTPRQGQPLLTQKSHTVKTTDGRNTAHKHLHIHCNADADLHRARSQRAWRSRHRRSFTDLMLQATFASSDFQSGRPNQSAPSAQLPDPQNAGGGGRVVLASRFLRCNVDCLITADSHKASKANTSWMSREKLPPTPTKDVLVSMETPASSQG